MLRKTFEIRWFWTVNDPQKVVQWFCQGHIPSNPEQRTDQYLWLAGCRNCGIKLREGRLEVKSLLEQGESIEILPQLSGHIQTWVKWLPGPEFDQLPSATLNTGDRWLAIRKQRWLRWFGLDAGEIVDCGPEPTGDFPGCQTELTRLSFDGEASQWLSLAIEMPDEDLDLDPQAFLLPILTWLFHRQPEFPLDLTDARCGSYPDWLRELAE